MTPLERITARVNRNGDVNDQSTLRPLLTIEEFFDGNDASGSIGCNLTPQPTPAEFRRCLEEIAARPEVSDVRVQVAVFDDEAWPFADTVIVVTFALPGKVKTWFPEELCPDDCHPAALTDCEPLLTPGIRVVACWWD